MESWRIRTCDDGVPGPLVAQFGSEDPILAGSGDGGLLRWDVSTGAVKWSADDGGFGHDLIAVRVEDGRTLLAMATEDGIQRFDARTGRLEPDPDEDIEERSWTSTFWSVASGTLPDGTVFIAGAGHGGTVNRWTARNGEPMGPELRGHGCIVFCVAVIELPDGRSVIISGDEAGTILRWDPVTGKTIGKPFRCHEHGIVAIEPFHLPTGQLLIASMDGEGVIHRWDAVSGELFAPPFETGHWYDMEVLSTADGRVSLITAGGEDERIRGWDALTGRLLWEIEGDALAASVLPDGRSIRCRPKPTCSGSQMTLPGSLRCNSQAV